MIPRSALMETIVFGEPSRIFGHRCVEPRIWPWRTSDAREVDFLVEHEGRPFPHGAAYGIGVEDRIGSLEAGKKADLIVLDQNLFEIDPHDIHNTKVLLTIMDGVVRHRDGF